MKLYVMRHGETLPNTMHLITGKQECDLTKNGIKQAKEVKEKFHNINFDVILTSPLSRARITASTIVNKPIIIDKRLIERDYGAFEWKKKKDIDYNGYWNYHLNLNRNNGESIKTLFMRIENLIADLIRKYPHKNVLLVTHSGVARAIHYYITGIPENGDLTPLEIPNCSCRVYEINEEEIDEVISH